jgi:hypothetical protein
MQNTIKSALESSGTNFQVLEENDKKCVLRLGFGLKNGNCDTIIDIDSDWKSYMIMVFLPTNVDENKRRRIAELLNRMNTIITIGNFEVDFQTGRVRFKVGQVFEEINADADLIFRRQMQLCLHTMDEYIPVIMSVIYASVLPEQALNQYLNNIDSSLN